MTKMEILVGTVKTECLQRSFVSSGSLMRAYHTWLHFIREKFGVFWLNNGRRASMDPKINFLGTRLDYNLVTWLHWLCGLVGLTSVKQNVLRSFRVYFGDSYQYCFDIFRNMECKYMCTT